jgi:RNA polymerase sigma-70 factor (ECF subfamily)
MTFGDMLADCRRTHGQGTRLADTDLLEAARRGELDAFGELFERHKNTVYSFVFRSVQRREDAEDIVQEAFFRAWRGICGFRGESSLLTWLCRIAANLCAEHARSRKSRVPAAADTDLDQRSLEAIAEPSGDLDRRTILRQAIDESIRALPLSQRMVVELVDIQGFTSNEAAGIVGCSRIAVRVRLCAAHKTLRRLLSAFFGGGISR